MVSTGVACRTIIITKRKVTMHIEHAQVHRRPSGLFFEVCNLFCFLLFPCRMFCLIIIADNIGVLLFILLLLLLLFIQPFFKEQK